MSELVEGEVGEVEGTYELWSPEPFQPPPPVTARVVTASGRGLMLGRYRTPEAIRPESERAALAGRRVRARGRYLAKAPWTEEHAPPAFWTGGGPQLVDVVVELIE